MLITALLSLALRDLASAKLHIDFGWVCSVVQSGGLHVLVTQFERFSLPGFELSCSLMGRERGCTPFPCCTYHRTALQAKPANNISYDRPFRSMVFVSWRFCFFECIFFFNAFHVCFEICFTFNIPSAPNTKPCFSGYLSFFCGSNPEFLTMLIW